IYLDGNSVTGRRTAGADPGAGILVRDSSGIHMSENKLTDNEGLAIDLVGAANHAQVAPAIRPVAVDGPNLAVDFGVALTPDREYDIELFASPGGCTGDAAEFVGSDRRRALSYIGRGNTWKVPVTLPAGTGLTFTATDVLTGDTSGLSSCQTVPRTL